LNMTFLIDLLSYKKTIIIFSPLLSSTKMADN